ncbi:methyl-accepting chemotaxis protein [Halobacillus salinus]|uniref:methyl-accepting chemotaxis protein n=1 Tax=Halobacillus salinus TaxID=192814 RepID=UPI0015903719|nr:methyl-accepting chemotaxis protein [Halobacillus salinus]
MTNQKNKTMLLFAVIGIAVAWIIHFVHRFMPMNNNISGGSYFQLYEPYLYITLGIPMVLTLLTFSVYRFHSTDKKIPWLMSLTFTFISLAMIVNGEGMVVYHFSIFLVVALIAFYDRIDTISLMTSLFAFFHIAAMFAGTEFLYGSSSYTWFMFALHAFYLVLTSVGTSYQIVVKNRYTTSLERSNQEKQERIQSLFKQIDDMGRSVKSTVDTLGADSEKATQSFEKVTTLLKDRNQHADYMVSETEQNAIYISEVQSAIEQIDSSIEAVSTQAQDTVLQTKRVQNQIEDVVSDMQMTRSSIQETNDGLIALHSRSTEIGSITEEISKITESTNLLALNASIEAARAGEHGKGFSVVADEVRKLALQSEEATQRILVIVQSILEDIQEANDSSTRSVSQVAHNREQLSEMAEVFHELQGKSTDVEERTHEVRSATQELLSSTQSITETFDKLVHFTKQAKTQNKHVLEASKFQHQSMQHMLTNVQSLAEMTASLNSLIASMSGKGTLTTNASHVPLNRVG